MFASTNLFHDLSILVIPVILLLAYLVIIRVWVKLDAWFSSAAWFSSRTYRVLSELLALGALILKSLVVCVIIFLGYVCFMEFRDRAVNTNSSKISHCHSNDENAVALRDGKDPVDVRISEVERMENVRKFYELQVQMDQLETLQMQAFANQMQGQAAAIEQVGMGMRQQVYDNLNRIETSHSVDFTPTSQYRPYRAKCYIHNCDYQVPGSCPYCSTPDYGTGKMVPCAKHGHKYNTKYGCPLCRAESR